MHLTKILSFWTSTDLEFVISVYVLKYSNNLDSHLFQVRADTQDGEIILETEVCLEFEKMLKSTCWFLYDSSKWLGFACV